ncbi:sigma-70 family RNA polymerase sigma factor [Cognatishimia sp. F0-27]|uniref:sigma-70 family RNA polymerase sigma factor n=1 Tax=Cognatishimia sp. F0-27 TaxID=2816855 RepID=UPI001D0C7BFB|nr:sigma-70 family RNA polymerase sigma factor [Cognatishimia sp. F0-27]MCC1492923.1 sigma-70 family RNA polymerase sigma factor [Cognatishimia sp. F0-27]
MTPDPRDELVEHVRSMRAFATTLTRNSALADDIVQDTLEKAWTKIDQFEAGTNMRAWLFTILRNTYYAHFRKHRREVEDADGTLAGALTQSPDHDGRLELRDFNAAFATLNPEQQEALILIGAEGFSYEEAAETVGASVGTIKSRVNRARARLTELLDGDGAGGTLSTPPSRSRGAGKRPSAA